MVYSLGPYTVTDWQAQAGNTGTMLLAGYVNIHSTTHSITHTHTHTHTHTAVAVQMVVLISG